MRRTMGFTLIELLVAVAILGVFALLAFGGLSYVLQTRADLVSSEARSREVRAAIQGLVHDIRSLQARPVRNPYSTELEAALSWDDFGQVPLALTRGGWSNPLDRPRGVLQRVAYRIEDDVLIRMHWQVLDRAPDSVPVEREILHGVAGLDLRFLGRDRIWYERWPQRGEDDLPMNRELPLAVEFEIEVEGWGRIRRLVEVPG